MLLSHEAYLDNQTLFFTGASCIFSDERKCAMRILRLILTVKRVKFGFTIEHTGWQEAPFKNFQTLDIDLKWFCLIPSAQFQFCFELKRIVVNSGISEYLLKISGAEPTPASNPGYAARGMVCWRQWWHDWCLQQFLLSCGWHSCMCKCIFEILLFFSNDT